MRPPPRRRPGRIHRAVTWVMFAWWYFFGVACAPLQVGPFILPEPVPCRYDGDCGPKEQCRFPAVDTHAICMPGENEFP